MLTEDLMTYNKKEILNRLKLYFGTFLAVMGLMMAGSDGPYFPWPNLVGLLTMIIIAFLVAWEEEKLEWIKKEQSGQIPEVRLQKN